MSRTVAVVAAVVLAACSSASATTGGAPTPAPVPAPTPPVTAVPVTPPPLPKPVPPPRDTTAAVNVEGYYELQIAFAGSPLTVALELWKEAGLWHGTVGNASVGSADLTAFAQDGNKVRVSFAAPTGEVVSFALELKADNTVTGTWSGLGDGSQVSGRKTR